MYLTEDVLFPSLSPFRFSGKRSTVKNLDLVSRRFDEALLYRLKSLVSCTNPSRFSLSWLSLAVDLLSSTHADAEKIISEIGSSSGMDHALGLYLDDSVKLLDACNSIISEIEGLRQHRLLIHYALHLLEFSGADLDSPSIDKLSRAKKSLTEWTTSPPESKKGDLRNPASLIRDLAIRLEDPPNGKISNVGKLIHRTIYTVGAVAVLVSGVVVAALAGSSSEVVRVRVPSEFVWADAFNGLETAVAGEIKRLFGDEKKRFIGDLDKLESCVGTVCDIIDSVTITGGENLVGEQTGNKLKKMETAVKELKTATEAFSDGLDRLFSGVDRFFHTVLCTRNGVLDNFRVGPQRKGGKLCK